MPVTLAGSRLSGECCMNWYGVCYFCVGSRPAGVALRRARGSISLFVNGAESTVAHAGSGVIVTPGVVLHG